MAERDDELDLLDLEDDANDELPAADPFGKTVRPKKPWLLLGVALLVIVLATFIIIKTIGNDSAENQEVDLFAPTEVVETVTPPAPEAALVVPEPVVTAPVSIETGTPVREIEERKPVTFKPEAGDTTAQKPAAKPVTEKKIEKPASKPAEKKSTTKTATSSATWYVQFGSYSTRTAAEAAQKKIRAQHPSLFDGKQFVILAAVLPNGTTTYRLRIAFTTSSDANGFCQNAKSDGLDCYVAK